MVAEWYQSGTLPEQRLQNLKCAEPFHIYLHKTSHIINIFVSSKLSFVEIMLLFFFFVSSLMRFRRVTNFMRPIRFVSILIKC